MTSIAQCGRERAAADSGTTRPPRLLHRGCGNTIWRPVACRVRAAIRHKSTAAASLALEVADAVSGFAGFETNSQSAIILVYGTLVSHRRTSLLLHTQDQGIAHEDFERIATIKSRCHLRGRTRFVRRGHGRVDNNQPRHGGRARARSGSGSYGIPRRGIPRVRTPVCAEPTDAGGIRHNGTG